MPGKSSLAPTDCVLVKVGQGPKTKAKRDARGGGQKKNKDFIPECCPNGH